MVTPAGHSVCPEVVFWFVLLPVQAVPVRRIKSRLGCQHSPGGICCNNPQAAVLGIILPVFAHCTGPTRGDVWAAGTQPCRHSQALPVPSGVTSKAQPQPWCPSWGCPPSLPRAQPVPQPDPSLASLTPSAPQSPALCAMVHWGWWDSVKGWT